MDDNIYLHAINATNNGVYIDTYDTYIILCKILKCHALLSSRLQKAMSNEGFNGIDYVSLCDYSKRDIFNGVNDDFNAFCTYIRYSLSIMFPKDKTKFFVEFSRRDTPNHLFYIVRILY